MPPKKILKKIIIKPKPWGREIWFARTRHYAGKILELKKGHRFSLQYHEKKEETQFLIEGKLKCTFGANPKKLKTKILLPGQKIDIPPHTIHRAEALTKSIIFEVSTPELDDVTKLEDDYGRIGRGNDSRLDEKLAREMKKSKTLNSKL